MRDELNRKEFHEAIDTTLSGLQGNPFLAQRIMNQERTGETVVKKRLSVGLVLAIVLMLIAVTALAVALLSPKEIVEQVAVPMALENEHENYSNDELLALITTLNENGITLDEGSRMMQAFRSGRGYWERETIEEICYSAFGRDQSKWSLDQRHWYGEMMVAIGAWDINTQVLPEEGELTPQEARSLAAQTVREIYGISLPAESDENWQIIETFQLGRDDETDTFPREGAAWSIWYYHRVTDNADYIVTFGRHGESPEATRARYLEAVDTTNVYTAMDDLAKREGGQTLWSMETWAECGELIRDLPVTGGVAWLYQHAGYRMPPEGAISTEQACEIARQATGVSGLVDESIICCTDHDRPIYKVCQKVFFDGSRTGARYDAVWCLELDCMTGEILTRQEYTYGPDSNFMMMYVPVSLLSEVPDFGEAAREAEAEQQARPFEETEEEYGPLICFWPLTVQAEVLGEPHAVPTQAELDRALAIATQAVADEYGADALPELGACQTGVIHQVFDDMAENRCMQLNWEFMFTTDPEYLSDGYRVRFVQLIYQDGREDLRDLTVEHANLGNG